MDVDYILIKLKKDIKYKSYDYVPTGKNKTSRRKFGLTMILFYVKIKVNDGRVKILSCHEDECL